MDFDDGGVHRHGFDFDTDQLLALQFLEDGVEHAVLRPAVHTSVNGVPVSEALGQAAPLATVLGDIQNRVQHRQVGQAHIAPLAG